MISRTFNKFIVTCGSSAALMGSLGLSGWITGFRILSSFSPAFIPMSPDTASAFLVIGILIILSQTQLLNRISKYYIYFFLFLFSLYGLLKFIEFFIDINLTFSDILFPGKETLGRFLIRRMSPITGLLIFLTGISLLLAVLDKKQIHYRFFISGSAIIILVIGFISTVGYLYGTPILYGGDIIPVAAPTALGFIFIGLGLAAVSGKNSLFYRLYTEETAILKLLRVFLPSVMAAVLLQGFLLDKLTRNAEINRSLISALFSLAFTLLTGIMIIRLSNIFINRTAKTEEALKESESRYRNIVELATDLIYRFDAKGTIVYVNPTVIKIFNSSNEELIGKSFLDFVHPDFKRHTQYVFYSQFIKKIPTVYNESLVITKEGKQLWLGQNVDLIVEEGEIKGFQVLSRDITERKLLEQKAEDAHKIKSNFLSNMSHELRTPMIGILGYTELMMEKVTEPELSGMIKIINKSGQRLLTTLNQILDLSRIEADKMEIIARKFSLDELLDRVYTLFKNASGSANIKFILKNSLPGITINTDERIIEGILNNLINNAIKFTYEGSITIAVDKYIIEQVDYIKFSVMDTGIGISQEDQAIIFSEFRQASEGYSRKFEGTGLGLTLTQKFVGLLGGEIFVKSEPGTGSNFYFLLPWKLISEW